MNTLTQTKMSKATPIIYTGSLFKRLRTELNVSVYSLVNASKVSRQQINRFEAGQNDIRLSTLTKLLTALYGLKSNGNENKS